LNYSVELIAIQVVDILTQIFLLLKSELGQKIFLGFALGCSLSLLARLGGSSKLG
jgi:hypothetical protein